MVRVELELLERQHPKLGRKLARQAIAREPQRDERAQPPHLRAAPPARVPGTTHDRQRRVVSRARRSDTREDGPHARAVATSRNPNPNKRSTTVASSRTQTQTKNKTPTTTTTHLRPEQRPAEPAAAHVDLAHEVEPPQRVSRKAAAELRARAAQRDDASGQPALVIRAERRERRVDLRAREPAHVGDRGCVGRRPPLLLLAAALVAGPPLLLLTRVVDRDRRLARPPVSAAVWRLRAERERRARVRATQHLAGEEARAR